VPEVVLLTVAGLQLPLKPFEETDGKAGTDPPLHIVKPVPKGNVGIAFAVTVTVNVAGFAHSPAAGVNVYVPEAVLLTVAGFQLPLIPLEDVAGNAGTEFPSQIASEVPKLNVGSTIEFTVTFNVVDTAH
jgi:hypothetical protein